MNFWAGLVIGLSVGTMLGIFIAALLHANYGEREEFPERPDPPDERDPRLNPGIWPDDYMLEAAWGIIANVGRGNWDEEPEDWRVAAEAWRDAYHRGLAPVPVPPSGDPGDAEDSVSDFA